MAEKALIYIHGKGGTAAASEYFQQLFPEYDTFGFDYKAENPWEAEVEYKGYFTKLSKEYSYITVIASSLGAYFLMIAGVSDMIQKAFLVSPIVDMVSTGFILMSKLNIEKIGLTNISNAMTIRTNKFVY